MTPEQKAKELFEKFSFITANEHYAKQCALIAVDEILKAIDEVEDKSIFAEAKWMDAVSYWQQVKEEIEKL